MAAALFRRGTGLCVRCIQRELCRVVWRPQAALYSSKPSDTKQPRRTHIKKAKPQPAVDVAKLLEQIFSQQRPGTAPPAGKVRPAKASSMFTKPPSTSSVKLSASQTEPAVSVFTAASSLKPVDADTSSGSSQTSTETTAIETNVAAVELTEQPSSTPFPAATVEPLIETTIESPVEPFLSPAETLDIKAAVVEGPIQSITDDPAEETQASGVVYVTHSAKEEYLIETAKESQIEASHFTPETLEIKAAAEGQVEPTVVVAAQEVETKSEDSTAAVESALETVELSVEAQSAVDATVIQTNNPLHAAEETALIETINASVESSSLPVETLESRAAGAEGSVETIQAQEETAAQSAHTDLTRPANEELFIVTAIESPVARDFPVETLETETVEGPVEPIVDAAAQEVETTSTDSGGIITSCTTKEEPLIETTVEATVESSSSSVLEGATADAAALIQNSQESAPLENEPTVESEEGENRSEKMTLESVTLLESEVMVASLKTEELLQTKSLLDEKAEKQLQELLVQTETGAENKAAAASESSSEDESEILTEVLSKWDSLSEDLQELEGESGMLVNELLCHVPAVVSKPGATSAVDAGASGESLQVEEKETEAESMTLESITLANVKAEVGGLETEVLQETSNALEKEADGLAEKEKMEVTPMEEDVAVFEDTAEAETYTLDFISEATDAIEAETSVMLEAMFGSEQGLRQPLQKPEQLDQSVGKESGEKQEVSVLEAMSLESVTLAEVEASLGTLESQSLSETADYLEKEAEEIVVGEERMEVEEMASPEETAEALDVESLSLSEDLQIEELMEELLFSEPRHVAGGPTGQIVKADILYETVVAASVDVGTAAAVLDDCPASPTLKEEELLEEEVEKEKEEEEGAQAEALNEDGSGTHADLDPVQRLFLEKIREYRNIRRLNGGPLEAEPDYEKYLLEETAKLQRLYGGGDLTSFPQFTFSDPEMDQDSK